MNEISSVRSLVTQYAHRKAQSILASLSTVPSPDTTFRKCVALVQQLANLPDAGGLTVSVLQDMSVIAYTHGNSPGGIEDLYALQKIAYISLKSSSKLRNEVKSDAVEAFQAAFSLASLGQIGDSKLQVLQRTSYCLISLLPVVSPDLVSQFAVAELVVTLAQSYDGLHVLSDSQASKVEEAIRTKAFILDNIQPN
jgi:hypothetical protein